MHALDLLCFGECRRGEQATKQALTTRFVPGTANQGLISRRSGGSPVSHLQANLQLRSVLFTPPTAPRSVLSLLSHHSSRSSTAAHIHSFSPSSLSPAALPDLIQTPSDLSLLPLVIARLLLVHHRHLFPITHTFLHLFSNEPFLTDKSGPFTARGPPHTTFSRLIVRFSQ